ncbi:MAG: hypothetical protein R2807_10870 [Chitinophagales bacterium]
MKNTLLLGLFFTCIFSSIDIMASDDVYDAPAPKKEKIKQVEKTPTTPLYQTPSTVEKTVPYTEDDNRSSQRQSSYNDTRGNDDEYYYSDDYSGSFGYTERIRRFHNPSIQFNLGWSNWNNYYDPWYSSPYDNVFGWNNWNNYSFTPSWMSSYHSFYNPFWNSTTYIIFQPGFSSWYNTVIIRLGILGIVIIQTMDFLRIATIYYLTIITITITTTTIMVIMNLIRKM